MFGKLLILVCLVALAVGYAAHGSSGAGPRHTYVVRSGDTLWSITGRFTMNVDFLESLNAIPDRDHLVPGWPLRGLISRHLQLERLEEAAVPLHVVTFD